MAELKYKDITEKNMKSVQSIHPCQSVAQTISQMNTMMIKRLGTVRKSVKSINPYQSVIQTICAIVKVHGGEMNIATKEGEGESLLFSCQLSESRISGIARITQMNTMMIKHLETVRKSVKSINPCQSVAQTISQMNTMMIKRLGTVRKSVKSINPYQSVIQTICAIVKVHGGEMNIATKEGEGESLLFSCQLSESRIMGITRIARNKKYVSHEIRVV